MTYQNDTTAPDIHLAAGVQTIADNKLWCCVAWTTAASLHQVAASEALLVLEIKTLALNKFLVTYVVLLLLIQVVHRVECVCKAKVGDDDVLVAVQEQIFELEIAVHDALLVQISNTRNQLGEESPSCGVLEVSVVEDIIEKFTSRSIFQDDSHVSLSLDELVQPNNIRVLQLLKDGDLAVDLGQASRVSGQTLLADQLDCHLYSAFLFPTHLDLSKFTLTQGLPKNVVTKLDLFAV